MPGHTGFGSCPVCRMGFKTQEALAAHTPEDCRLRQAAEASRLRDQEVRGSSRPTAGITGKTL